MNKNIFKIENGTLVDVLDKNITEAVIPNSVTSIGDSAFYNYKSLTSITIPDSVTSIGDWAFYRCESLTSVKIPNSVTSIGGRAFYNCKSLASVTIPNSVTSIGYSAFDNCTSLTSITIPDSIISIGKCAFYNCTSLTSITIPDSIISIGKCAFYNCTSLQSKTSNYKAFDLKNGNFFCRDYKFKPNEWSKEEYDIKPYERGYHYCTNLFEVFNYYYGELDKDIAIYECEIGDEVIKTETSKCCTNKIKPVKRLYRDDIIKLLNV